MEIYTIKIENGQRVRYPSTYGCDECGYKDTDIDMFYHDEKENLLFCSLHRKE